MQFIKTPSEFHGSKGYSYFPVDGATNYRRVIVLDPPEVPAEGTNLPTTRFFVFEYFQGQEVITSVPLRASKKQHLGAKDRFFLHDEVVRHMAYFSTPADDVETVETMVKWLEASSI